MNENYSLSDIAAVSRGNEGCGGFDGGWASWIIIFLIFAMFGWGNGGFGGYGGNGLQGALTRADLCQDMNFSELKSAVQANGQEAAANFRAIDNAVCTLGYNQSQLTNGVQMQLANGFGTLDTSLCQLGNNFAQQINGVQQQIAACCCENEKIALQNRYEAAQNTCSTLQAIDKVGDRVIDYLANKENQNLRDEVQSLRLAQSQCTQNAYLVNQLRPCPIPAYITCNPFATSFGIGTNNGGCGCNGGFVA